MSREGVRIGFLVSGQGRLALEAIRYHQALGFEPSFLLLDVHAARESETTAQQYGIPWYRLKAGSRSAVQGQIHDHLKTQSTDRIFLTFDRILDETVLNLFPGCFINLHLSLLPSFPGMRALERALERGTPFVGATMHLVTPQVDDGPTLAQCIHPVAEGETRESIGQKLFPLIRVLYLNVVRWAAQGRISTDVSGRARILDTRPGTGRMSPEPEWWPETQSVVR